jgi:RNA polymerase sigma-70 factor (ECF subfamily)
MTCPAASHESDAELLRRLLAGSSEVVARLYERHCQAVFDVARRTTTDEWSAREVVQDTFLTLWLRPHMYDPERGSLRTWLRSVARNRAVDRVRVKYRSAETPIAGLSRDVWDDAPLMDELMSSGTPVAFGTSDPAPDAATSARETATSLAEAVRELTPSERVVITLAYGSGLSQVEVAAELGWPLGTVKTRTRRALRNLRGRLGRDSQWTSPTAC